jgi:ribA/ribD-fused uncharacterized protein
VGFNWSFNRLQVQKRTRQLARSGIRVVEDYPIEIEQRRATLTNIARKAQRTPGFANTHVSGDKLIVKGKVFTVDTCNTLPEAINPCLQATQTKDNSTIFYTRFSKLSNHCPASFTDEDTQYRTSEQYYFAEKCRKFGDTEQLAKVLAAKDPKDCQRLGRQAKNIKGIDWADHEENAMKKACLAKFRGNRMAKHALLGTGTRALGEASRSTKWGIGMFADHPEAHNQDIWADNLLGNVLESVRDTIRDETNNPPPTPDEAVRRTVRHQMAPH